MRLISLEPFLTELVASVGLAQQLVAVSRQCDYPPEVKECYVVTRPRARGGGEILDAIGSEEVLWDTMRDLFPDVVLTRPISKSLTTADERKQQRLKLETAVRNELKKEVTLLCYAPRTLGEVYEVYESLAADLGVPEQGKRIHNRVQAQLSAWVEGFYQRMKNKRVSVFSGVSPLRLAGLWIPDLVRFAGGIYQGNSDGVGSQDIGWGEVREFRPDVIVVAPEGVRLPQVLKTFKTLEQLPGWEDVPAVKRGEVYFCDGLHHFYRPSGRIMDTAAVLFSAMAGLESGYITPRDSFYKLRWAELQRHRL